MWRKHQKNAQSLKSKLFTFESCPKRVQKDEKSYPGGGRRRVWAWEMVGCGCVFCIVFFVFINVVFFFLFFVFVLF